MSVKNDLIAIGVVGVVLLGAAWIAKRKIAAAVPYVNPADSRNVINQAVQGAYQGMTGSTGTLGGDLYDYWHPSRNEQDLRAMAGASFAVDFYQWLTNSNGNQIADYQDGTLFRGTFNPASDNNLIYRGVSALGGAFTGAQEWSLGAQIYDWTH
ncbi:MAG: hypothetical protein ACXW2U_00755 [Telluria sp.]